jgi:hypothetical protein
MRAIDGGANDVRRLGVAAVGALLCCTLAYATTSASAKTHKAGEGPTTIAGCKKKYPKHDTNQAACIKRVKQGSSHKSTKCPLKMEWIPQYGPHAVGIDFLVQLKMLGGPNPNSWSQATVAVQVTVRNPRIVICNATIGVTVIVPHAPVQTKEYHVAIGPHGGLSSSVTLPAEVLAPAATVYARRK